MTIIIASLLVCLFDYLDSLFFRNTIQIDDILDRSFHIRIYENLKHVFSVTEDIVSTSANYYRRLSVCKLLYYLRQIIEDIRKSGTTVLLVEQNAKKALAISDRAYVLETGKIVLSGKASDLINDESVKKAYLGE